MNTLYKEDGFKIYIDRLRQSECEEEIQEEFDPTFLNEGDPCLFTHPVSVQGLAYLVDGYLILNFDARTKAKMACSICSEEVEIELSIFKWEHQEPLESCKKAVFDFSGELRAALLLEMPNYPKCGGDKCLHREQLEKYFRKEEEGDAGESHPFKDLDRC